MNGWRLPEAPDLKALTGTVIGDSKGRCEIVWIVSAGELLDEIAHRQIWKRGSTAERCAMYGTSRNIKEGE
jgi:hypothetical protein